MRTGDFQDKIILKKSSKSRLGFGGPFGPSVREFEFFDIILLILKICPQSRLSLKSPVLEVACPFLVLGKLGPGKLGPSRLGPGRLGPSRLGPGRLGPGKCWVRQIWPLKIVVGILGPKSFWRQIGPGRLGLLAANFGPGKSGLGKLGPWNIEPPKSQIQLYK